MTVTLSNCPKVAERPDWMNDEGYKVVQSRLLPGEAPRDMYWRVASCAAERLNKPEMANRFFQMMWDNWLCLATPVAANMGTKRGLPISCFGIAPADDTSSIMLKMHEQAMMSKHGGGVGIYGGNIRHRGAPISAGGVSEGVCSWAVGFQTVMNMVSQGGVRRGAAVLTLDVDHPDFDEFLGLREIRTDDKAIQQAKKALKSAYESGAISLDGLIDSAAGIGTSRTYQLNQSANITDSFMERVRSGEPEAVDRFKRIIKTRVETGEPYLMFIDTANRLRGECYDRLGLKISQTNLCSEIFLHSSPEYSFVCCLSSMNAAKYEAWRNDPRAVRDAIWFLDAVMEEFIQKAKDLPGFTPALNFAIKSRALGLGVIGLHSLYQKNRAPVGSFLSNNLNKALFKHLAEESYEASLELAEVYGEPEWCRGTGRRNTHSLAVAPTLSNSIASGQWTPGIEPYPGNYFTKNTQEGYISCRNPQLAEILELSNNNTEGVWESILERRGSVQHLDFLSDTDKQVFRTFREIPQHILIEQAIDRQQYMDSKGAGQGQSLNLAFRSDEDPTYIARCHTMAWAGGLKSLYYCKSEAAKQADIPSRQAAVDKFLGRSAEPQECEACSG